MRITRGDGLVDRDQAAQLCGVTPDAITIWSTRGYVVTVGAGGERVKVRQYLPVAKREGRRPLYNVIEVQKAEYATRKWRRAAPRDFPVAA